MDNKSDLLSAEQLADRLNVPVSWVWLKAREGKLPHKRLGKYYRFPRDEIENWLERQTSGSDQD